jgi:hypothetical protein
MSFDSITNRQEYFSEHYLASVIQADLNDLRKSWKAAEGSGKETPRSGLKALGVRLFEAKQEVLEGVPGAQEAATDSVLEALGFEPERTVIETQKGEGTEVSIPVVCVTRDGGGSPHLIAIEAAFSGDVDGALGRSDFDPDVMGDTASGLLEPVTSGDKVFSDPSKAISAIFEAENPPRHVLLIAGAIVILASRGKWSEGRFLAVNLDIALERADARAKGELETIAALFGADTLLPAGNEAEALIEDLDIKSLRNAAGVSEDLREGVRLAVEEIANEVISQRKEKKLGIPNGFADSITRESLRFLYRILFLLYAEAKPDLDVVPALAEGYAAGYGLDRLRELALTELETEAGRNGSHLHDSLDLLFQLVNEGHRHNGDLRQGDLSADGIDETGFIFNPLESDLFAPKATPLIDSVRLRNEVLRQVLARILLTAEKGNTERRFISYSALGINQLGAVYERLMAYTGFLAEQDLYEIRELDKHDEPKPDGGTWVVPIERAQEFPEAAFVTEEDPVTGESRRLLHPKGSFVFRLSGRQRQRSASYYTPEILTEFVVRHALEELLDQDGQKTPADDILNLTVCEPALGSGAFLNEAINQLARRYLDRRQEELGETIDPEDYPNELQNVKAHFALHQSYGVDLNSTAVELAEVSLWLNAMHTGLKAPWFGLHLRRGNSLVGARRSVYAPEQLVKKAWLKAIPTDRPLADGAIHPEEIHHFLLPGEGWGSAGDTKEAKELEPEKAKALRDWSRRIKAGRGREEARRLAALARRVETLWALAIERLERGESDLRRNLEIFGQQQELTGDQSQGDLANRKAVEEALEDEQSALARLRLVMDAWCALWFWPLDSQPPEWGQWIEMLEAVLGVDEDPEANSLPESLSFDDLPALLQREQLEEEQFGMTDLSKVRTKFRWLDTVASIREKEAFFHWDLEFGHIMRRGGFDLQVGNPPWVRPRWLDDSVLAEFDPWFGFEDSSHPAFQELRSALLMDTLLRASYLSERSSNQGLTRYLSSAPYFPELHGIGTNLYMAFMARTWSHQSSTGRIGLLHPEGHFTHPDAEILRRNTYSRLRRHWHFVNEAQLFPEVGHDTDFGVHIYGTRGEIRFQMAANLQLPATLDGSLNALIDADYLSEIPGIKTVDGDWDRRPHPERVYTVDSDTLRLWSQLFDPDSEDAAGSRLMRPHSNADMRVIAILASPQTRVLSTGCNWTSALNETQAKKRGIITRHTLQPETWDDLVLQGPHFTNANPFNEQPGLASTQSRDRVSWDLNYLEEDAIPRSAYQIDQQVSQFEIAGATWDDRPSTAYFRLIHRVMTKAIRRRAFHVAVIPPGPTHINACHTYRWHSVDDTCHMASLCVGLPYDFLLKVSGGGATGSFFQGLPFPRNSPFRNQQLLRFLRLNCLTAAFSHLWQDIWNGSFETDEFTTGDARLGKLAHGRHWSSQTPLRSAFERRMALVELDVLAALSLEIDIEELCAIYRSQFGVLRAGEWTMRFDRNGDEVPGHVLKDYEKNGNEADLNHYELPFTRPDREAEMRAAYAEFERRVAEA